MKGGGVVPEIYTQAANRRYPPDKIRRFDVSVAGGDGATVVSVIVYGALQNTRKRFKLQLTRYVREFIPMLHALTSRRRRQITVEYYPLGKRKRLPVKRGMSIDASHVNNGFCYVHSRDDGDVNIVIYRREEFFKVLAHELIHLYDAIPRDISTTRICQAAFAGATEQDVTEAQTELLATVLNTLVIHRLSDRSFNDLLSCEIAWCREVTMRLVSHFDARDSSCDQNGCDLRRVASRWRSSTHSFWYYMVRCRLLTQLGEELAISNTTRLDACVHTRQNNLHGLRMTINDIENVKLT